MKYLKVSFWGLLTLLTFVNPLFGKDVKTVAVFPFSIHSAENIDYMRQGIEDMLRSRLSMNEKLSVVSRDAVQSLMKEAVEKELTAADVSGMGKKLGADYVVWGSLTKIGGIINLDGKLQDMASNQPAVALSSPCTLDDIIPKINDFAGRITGQILGGAAPAVAAGQTTAPEIIVSRKPSPTVQRESEIISAMGKGKKGAFTSSVNPYFINAEQPLDRKSFWKSQQFSNEFKGVDIGDVNGDKLNETVFIDTNTIFIYQKKDNAFKLVQQLKGNRYDSYISLDVADVNGNGIPEIIVSSYSGQEVSSFVVEYKNGKFETIASRLPWFMRVIQNSESGPILLGQLRGIDNPFDTPIYEIVWNGGTYREGRRMKIPQGLSIYGMTMDRLGSAGAERIIALNSDDYLCIFEQTLKPLSKVLVFGGSEEFRWKSEEPFGGSNTTIEPVNRATSGEIDNKTYFINSRILTYDTNKDGKREIIIPKNISSSGRMFQNLKLFTSAEVYNLEWDGLGIVESWKTKKISGYIADYQFKDIDNDGANDIVLALVLSTGGSIQQRSVIVSYSLQGAE
jgi:TolB-like protein